MIGALALAGLFGISSFISREISKSFEPRAAEAAATKETVTTGSPIKRTLSGVEYRVIYYYVDSDWDYRYRFDPDDLNVIDDGDKNHHCFCFYHDKNIGDIYGQTKHAFGTGKAGDTFFSRIISDYAAVLYLPSNTQSFGATSCDTTSWTSGYYTNQFDISTAGQACVITTANTSSNQGATWVTEDTLFSTYLKQVKVSISSEWNDGKSYNLDNLWVWCIHIGSDGKQIGTWYGMYTSVERTGRAFKITDDMIYSLESGKKYAKIYVPARSGSSFRIQLTSYDYGLDPEGFDDDFEATVAIGVSTVTDSKIYMVTSNNTGANFQTGTLKDFPNEKSGYYLIGSGSFTSSGDKWTTGTGVEMYSDFDDLGVLKRQYLTAGDAFTITNSDYSYIRTYANMSAGSLGSDYFVQARKANLQCTIGKYYEDNQWKPSYTFWNEYLGATNNYTPSDQNVEVYTWRGDGPDWYGNNNGQPVFWTNKDGNYWSWGSAVGSDNWRAFKFSFPLDGVSQIQVFRYDDNHRDGEWWSGIKTDELVNFDYLYLDCSPKTYKPVYVKQSGYYDIHLTSSGEISIELCIGDEMYLDLDSAAGTGADKWQNTGDLIGAYFFNTSDDKVYKANFMTNWHDGTNNTALYEVIFPTLTTGTPNRMVFVNLDSDYRASDPKDGNWWILLSDGKYYKVLRQTTDVYIKPSVNSYYLDGTKTASKFNWQEDGTISYDERADYYGLYFQGDIGCTYAGTTPPAGAGRWGNYKSEYGNMCDSIQTIIHDVIADENVAGIKHAMATYDYIVAKPGYDYEDFINRSTNENSILHNLGLAYQGTLYNTLFQGQDNSSSVIIIIIVSSLSILSITALSIIVVRKRKRETNFK